MYSSSGFNFCGVIWSLFSSPSDGIASSCAISCSEIHSSPVRNLTSHRVLDGPVAVFAVTYLPGRSLSAPVPALTPLRPGFPSFPVQIWFAGLCFTKCGWLVRTVSENHKPRSPRLKLPPPRRLLVFAVYGEYTLWFLVL